MIKTCVGNNLMEDKNYRLDYYIIDNNNSYGVEVSRTGNQPDSVCILNVTGKKDKIENIANTLLKEEVYPEHLVDIVTESLT
jgi:hypothetical protein